MAITVGTSTVTSGNRTTSFTLAVDVSVLVGDILLLGVTNRDATADPTVSDDGGGAAWTKVGSQVAGTNGAITVWWKRAEAGTAGATITVSGCTGSCAGTVTPYRGALASGTPVGTPAGEANASGNETQVGITVGTANSFVCLFVGCTSNDTLNPATYTATDPTALAEQAEGVSAGGSDCSMSHASAVKTTSGATGAISWAQTNGTGASMAFELLAATSATLTTSTAFDGGVTFVVAASTRAVPAGAVAIDGGGTVAIADTAVTRATSAAFDGVGAVTVAPPAWATSTSVAIDGAGTLAIGASSRETFTSTAIDGVGALSIGSPGLTLFTAITVDGASGLAIDASIAGSATEHTTSFAVDGGASVAISASTRSTLSAVGIEGAGAIAVTGSVLERFASWAADAAADFAIADATVEHEPATLTTVFAIDGVAALILGSAEIAGAASPAPRRHAVSFSRVTRVRGGFSRPTRVRRTRD